MNIKMQKLPSDSFLHEWADSLMATSFNLMDSVPHSIQPENCCKSPVLPLTISLNTTVSTTSILPLGMGVVKETRSKIKVNFQSGLFFFKHLIYSVGLLKGGVRRRKWHLFPKIDTTSLLKTKYIVTVGRLRLETWFKILS